jgi:phosphoribosylanthranilate isomerase
MTKVKICGLTNIEDALFAANSGADALGFVFYKKSPRYVSPQTVAEILPQLPPFVKTFGLFVNEPKAFIEDTVRTTGLNAAQIHFDVNQTFLDDLKIPAIGVVRAKSAEDIHNFPNSYKIIDSFCESYGGSGKRLNLEWFENVDCSKIILAGGLNAQNVANVCRLGFYGVDVSSGVESMPGKKDSKKVKQFIDNAKKC